MTKFDIKPGDLIEWVYKHNNELVIEHEILWSTIEKAWVPIGRNLVHLCTSVDGKTYSLLNEEGLFRAHVDDETRYPNDAYSGQIVPRVRG